jgi:acyl-CoA synthetase (AMP-forming)/AMP-acid ligase II
MNIQTKPTRDPAAQHSLVQKIQKRAWDTPGKTAFAAFSDLSQEGIKISYGELDRKAKEIAATLQSFTLPQEKALLIFSPGLDFITALFGCLYAGVIAVPVCPPDFKHLDRDLPSLKDIIIKTQANIVLTDETFFSLSGYFYLLAPDQSSIQWFAIDRIGMASEYDFRPIPITEQFIAILDYQPGSATFPDGVNLTHANLLSSLKTNETLLNFSEGAVSLSWLPPFHEIGLVEGILQGVFSGCESLLIPTRFVLEDPLVWLKLISRYKVTISGGPDYIYDRCSHLVSQFRVGDLQLGQWATAYTNSNRLSKACLDNFYDSFKYYGFKKESFVPYYRLIGASLIVSGGRSSNGKGFFELPDPMLAGERYRCQSADCAESLVGYQLDKASHPVFIIDSDSQRILESFGIGEVVVDANHHQGSNAVRDENRNGLQKNLPDSDSSKLWRTGDLGFIHQGYLYTVGNKEEYIYSKGRWYYAPDIERTLSGIIPELKHAKSFFFTISQQREYKIVMICEVDEFFGVEPHGQPTKDAEWLLSRIQQAALEQLGLAIHTLCLITPGSVPMAVCGTSRWNLIKEYYHSGFFDEKVK